LSHSFEYLRSLIEFIRFLGKEKEGSKIEAKIEINPNDLKPCHGKIVSEWTWSLMKRRKYVVHVNREGEFTVRPLSSEQTYIH